MYDLEALNLKPGSGKTHSISPDADAKARAKAVEMGAKWKCSRVNAWVDVTDCLARYTVAHAARPAHSPCLECSSIAAHVRKIGGIPEPQPQQKESAKMAAPAKKLEVVQPEVNPFAKWEKFDARGRLRAGLKSFATLNASRTLAFSTLAGEELGLLKFASVDVYANNDKLGIHFREDDEGQLRLTRNKSSKGTWNIYVSARGVCKQYGLDYLAGKHLPLTELAPGFVEIDLAREVA